MNYYVILTACEDIEESYSFDNLDEARAYSSGYNAGCSKFGGDGWAMTEEELKDDNDNGDYDEHLAHIEKHKLESGDWLGG